MIILTAANKVYAKDDYGKIYKYFSFKDVIQTTVDRALKFGYTPVVYDLGELGIGEKIRETNETFQNKGYYCEIQKDYLTKSLFKPDIVKKCLTEYNDFTIYLDGDAILYDRIDEVVNDSYDIGVTLRRPSEMEGDWYERHFDIVKYVNAGVIFFNPTPATLKFVELWKEKTEGGGNDQKALNDLVCQEEYPKVNSIVTINRVRVKYFSCEKYNFYYFNEGLMPGIKILHFKGDVRHYYPFNWKVHFYCLTVVPLLNKVKQLTKKLILSS